MKFLPALLLVSVLPLPSKADDAPQRARPVSALIAEQRARDAETAARIALTGAELYESTDSKAGWQSYCEQSLQLADEGRFREAVRMASMALHLGTRNGDARATAYARRDLAYAYMLAGDADNARQWAQAAIDSASAFSGPTPFSIGNELLSPAYKVLGDAAAMKGEYALARTHYEKALDEVGLFSTVKPMIELARANLELRSGQVAAAREAFQRLRRGSQATQALRGLGNIALSEGQHEEAARHFRDAIRQAGDDRYASMWALLGLARVAGRTGDKEAGRKAFDSAIEAAEALRSGFQTLDNRTGFFGTVQDIFDEAVDFGMQSGQTAWAFSVSERSRARATLEETRGSGALPPRVADGNALSQALPEGVEVIAYHVTRQATHAFRVSRSGLIGHSLAIGDRELAQSVDALRRSVAAFDGPGSRKLATRLHERLVAPVFRGGATTLVIIPHRSLHALPFNLLYDGKQYLVEQVALASHLSASLLADMLSRPPAAAGTLLALGNPDRDNPEEDLPAAEEEVRAIATGFLDAAVHVRKDATRQRLLAAAPSSGIVHIAAHAMVDDIDPAFSRILLARTGIGRADVEAHEIAQLNLRGVSLVVVSACSSGLGTVRAGEEFVGFKRAFAVSGARRLLVSLWPVADESTSQTMIDFYAGQTRAGAAEALRQAQLRRLKDPATSLALFWAPFMLVGDFRPGAAPSRAGG